MSYLIAREVFFCETSIYINSIFLFFIIRKFQITLLIFDINLYQ